MPLPQLTVPQATVKPAMPPTPAPVDGLEALINIVDSVKSPVGQEIVRGLWSRKLGIDIPTREEYELRKASHAAQMKELLVRNATANVEIARAAWIDMSPDLKKKYGVDDTTPDSDLKKFVEVANKERLTPEPLSVGQLSLVGLTQQGLDAAKQETAVKQKKLEMEAEKQAQEQADAPGKRAAELLTRAQGEQSNLDQLLKASQLAAAGGDKGGALGRIVDIMDQGAGASEKDFDESEPSRLLARSVVGGFQSLLASTPELAPYAARGFLLRHADFLKKNLSDLPQNSAGQLVAGHGDRGITDPATKNLGLIMDVLSNMMGENAFAAIGLPYTGVDPASLEGLDANAGEKP